jgi:hypothetical protein
MYDIGNLRTPVLVWLPLLSCLIKSVRCFGSVRRMGKAKRAHLDEISNGDRHGLALCPSYIYHQFHKRL